MEQPPALRKISLGLVALLLSALLAFVILEMGLRAFFGTEYYFPYYPNSARYFYPSEEITPGVTGVSTFSTNSYGTRGREPSGNEQLRILTIGGSTTSDTVLDDTEAWPARLEKHLDAKLGNQELVWVANSGIDGLNSHHHLMHAIYLLPRLPPIDYVIVHAGANDMGLWFHHREFDPDYLDDPENWTDRIGEAFRWSAHTPPDWPFYKRTAVWKTLSRVKDRLLTARAKRTENTRVIVQDAQLRWLEEQRQRRKEHAEQLLPKAKLATLPVALQSYGEVLSRIVDEVRANGSEPIFVTQVVQQVFRNRAERERLWMGAIDGGEAYVSEEEVPELMSRFNRQMVEVAANKGAFVLDLPTRLDSDGDLFYDGQHFNEAGADAAAEEIASFFDEQGLLDRVRDGS